MSLIQSLSSGNIACIDFDIAVDDNTFAQTSIVKATPRCKVYYSFRNEDTREDGEDRCTTMVFTEICSRLASLLSENSQEEYFTPAYHLSITTDDGIKHIFNNTAHAEEHKCPDIKDTAALCLSPDKLRTIIRLLADNIDEFTFLPYFYPHR